MFENWHLFLRFLICTRWSLFQQYSLHWLWWQWALLHANSIPSGNRKESETLKLLYELYEGTSSKGWSKHAIPWWWWIVTYPLLEDLVPDLQGCGHVFDKWNCSGKLIGRAWRFRKFTKCAFYPFQINFFKDHTKVILCPLMGAVTYIDQSRNARTLRLDLIEKFGCGGELAMRLQYTFDKVENMLKVKNWTIPLIPLLDSLTPISFLYNSFFGIPFENENKQAGCFPDIFYAFEKFNTLYHLKIGPNFFVFLNLQSSCTCTKVTEYFWFAPS